MLTQWQTNAIELSKRCRGNPKMLELLQGLTETVNTANGWLRLPGTMMIVVAYQPGLFDKAEFDRGADWEVTDE
jgi:hypothetical protein